jgi:hypothetical protein
VFIDYPGIPWRDQSGNTVSWTVISAIQGPGHCNWEAAAFISIGWPFGHSASTVADSRRYVRDPDHVLPAHWPFATTYDPSVTLPSDARDTGYRYGDAELWYSPSTVDREIYLVRGSTAERLPRDPEGLGCA